MPSPTPIAFSDNKPEQKPFAPVGETITLQKVKGTQRTSKTLVDQNETPTKEPSIELPPSESWVIVKSEMDTPADCPTIVKASEGVPSDREQYSSGDTPSQAPGAKQVWSGSGREQRSTRTSPTQAPPTALSGGSVLGGGSEVIIQNIEIEDIEEKESQEKDTVVDGASNLVFSVDDEEGGEKFSTPSAPTPQVSERLQTC